MKIIGQIHCQNENLSKITSILPKAQPITILSIFTGRLCVWQLQKFIKGEDGYRSLHPASLLLVTTFYDLLYAKPMSGI
jgi:hypothetical protein